VDQRADVVATPVEELFDAVAARLVLERRDVERDRIFRSEGLRAATGRFFAFARKGELVVKLAARRVGELVASGEGEPFFSSGRRMREWVCLRPRDDAACAAYVEEARAFATR